MLIHTVKGGDDLYSIAKGYSTYPQKLSNDNEPVSERLTEGDELAVIIPTKVITARGGDTLPSIARKYGIKESALLRQNVDLISRGYIRPGQQITLKQSAPTLGSASAIGRLRKGDSYYRLKTSLPFLTYLTIECAEINEDGDLLSVCRRETVKECLDSGKVPLLAVKDESQGKFATRGRKSAIDNLIGLAKKEGFKGVLLSFPELAKNEPEQYLELLLDMRKRFLGCDLILFTELNAGSPIEASEISDGAILNVGALPISEVKATLRDFAERTESSKIFVTIETMAKAPDKQMSISEAKRLCLGRFSAISTSEKTLLSSFCRYSVRNGDGVSDQITFPSLKYTKAKLAELAELGFSGISVEISSIDTARLCTFNSLFRRADYALPYEI